MLLNNPMKKKLIITALLVFVLLVIKNMFSGSAPAATVTTPEKDGKIVETAVVGESLFSEQVHITGKIAAQKEVSLSTQATGFMGVISVNSGDAVLAGETLARIQDTYGTANNGVREASIGVETARLSQENSIASLDQSVEAARIAYEKAQKDFDAAILTPAKDSTTVSKAQLDLENYITAQGKTLQGYETSYSNQLQIFQSFLFNVLDTSDTIIGVTDAKKGLNDSYEYLLAVTDYQKKNDAINSISSLLEYKNWKPDTKLPLVDRVTELQRVYTLATKVLSDVQAVLNNSQTDASSFTPTTLAAQKALVTGYQTQYNSISTGLVTFVNTAQSFLATYEKERSAKEQAAATTESNAKSTLDLAKRAYDTAVKTRDITLRQIEQSLASANIKYDNAEGGAARLSVVAPFSGVIIAKNTETGSLVSPGMSLFTLGDTSTLIVKTEMTAEQQKSLHVTQEVPLIIHGTVITGKLKSLSAGPDPVTHLYKAEISLPKVHPDVALGDIVDVIVTNNDKKSEKTQKKEIVVPFSALKNLGQETYAVYIFTPEENNPHAGIVHEREVKIGATNETSVTIIEGLKLGETIVTLGTLNVEDGDYVQQAGFDETIEVPVQVNPKIVPEEEKSL